MSNTGFWDDQERARKISEDLSSLKEDIDTAKKITQSQEELEAFLAILQEEKDNELEAEAEKKLAQTKKYLDKLET
ncbi:PCRF domain-containing protein, partial [bacterium]